MLDLVLTEHPHRTAVALRLAHGEWRTLIARSDNLAVVMDETGPLSVHINYLVAFDEHTRLEACAGAEAVGRHYRPTRSRLNG